MSEEMTPADRLEQALRDLEKRKQEAAERAAKAAPERERLAALWVKLQELPQQERREVLDAAGLKHVSAAPRPIEPVQGDGFMLPRKRPAPPPPEKVVRGGFIPPASLVQPARWQVWRHTPARPLWQCVALSLDMEPTDRIGDEARRGRGSYSRLPREYWDRLMVCQANLSLDGPIRPQGGLYAGMLRDVACEVLVSEVAAFLEGAGFAVPEEMRSVAPARPQSQAPQAVPAAAPGVQHRAPRRADPLEPVLELASSRALDASSWTSVWDALVVLAQSPDRPAPLLGYTEGEGVKWQADDDAEPVRYLKRDNLRDRWRRRM